MGTLGVLYVGGYQNSLDGPFVKAGGFTVLHAGMYNLVNDECSRMLIALDGLHRKCALLVRDAIRTTVLIAVPACG